MCSWVEDGLPAGGRLCTGARNPCESPVEQRCFQPTARSTAMKAAYRETNSRTDVSPRCRLRYGLPSRLFRLCDTTASCCCGARHGRAFQLSVVCVSFRCRGPFQLRDVSHLRKIAWSGSRPRSTKSASSVRASVAFSVEPSQRPSGILTPSVVMPSATTWVRSAIGSVRRPDLWSQPLQGRDRGRPQARHGR